MVEPMKLAFREGPQPEPEQEILSPLPAGFSDDALAQIFTERHSNSLLYIVPWKQWVIDDGTRWEKDITNRVPNMVRKVCREAAAVKNEPNEQNRIASGRTISAVERLAKSDPRHATTHEIFDTDLDIIGTPAGPVDLRKGERISYRPELYITKQTAVPPEGNCPLWHAFLNRIFNGNEELITFLQRYIGYALTGRTSEHALLFFHGTGRNGKSVLLNTISGLMGDYAMTAPMETFTASSFDRHPTEIAALCGARLVTASETEQGRQLNEARMKLLTGGDRLTARGMRQDFWSFTPQFSLIMSGNHKPQLNHVDTAIRERFNLVPFEVTIPPQERDKDLPHKLEAEWPGILAWAIEGARQWYEGGLCAPATVKAATDEFMAEEDTLGLWLQENTTPDSNSGETLKDLFKSWTSWAEIAGEKKGTQKAFSQNLIAKGFDRSREGGTGKTKYLGLRLNRQDYTDDPRYG